MKEVLILCSFIYLTSALTCPDGSTPGQALISTEGINGRYRANVIPDVTFLSRKKFQFTESTLVHVTALNATGDEVPFTIDSFCVDFRYLRSIGYRFFNPPGDTGLGRDRNVNDTRKWTRKQCFIPGVRVIRVSLTFTPGTSGAAGFVRRFKVSACIEDDNEP